MDDHDGDGLTAGMAAAWGVRAPAAQGPKPGLTLARILERGIAIADAEGLAALSMSRLAKDLGFTTMSLYRYVEQQGRAAHPARGHRDRAGPGHRTRGGRLAEPAGRLGLDAQMPAPPGRSTWIVQLPITGAPNTPPHTLEWVDQGPSRSWTGSGPERDREGRRWSGWSPASSGTRACCARTSPGRVKARPDRPRRAAHVPPRTRPAPPGSSTPQRFPALAATIAAAWSDDRAHPPDIDFDFGVQRILDGVEALIRARAQAP